MYGIGTLGGRDSIFLAEELLVDLTHLLSMVPLSHSDDRWIWEANNDVSSL